MAAELIYNQDGCEIWHGDCLDAEDVRTVMGDRKADLLNVDAPYSEKTHAGHDGGAASANRDYGKNGRTPEEKYAERWGSSHRRSIDYQCWNDTDVAGFIDLWAPKCAGWFCSTTDSELQKTWQKELERVGRYAFTPLPWVEVGSRVRLVGDGPSNWSCWLVVARPTGPPFSKWGTLRGAYILPAENHQNRPERVTGGKSIPGTVQLIEDYSRPGDLVVDPCLGGGTTMVAARLCGRRCIGMEQDRGRAELCARIMKDGARSKTNPRQERLFQ